MKAHWNWIKGKISQKFFTEIYNYTTIPQYDFWKKRSYVRQGCMYLIKNTKYSSNIVKYYNLTVFCFNVNIKIECYIFSIISSLQCQILQKSF